MLETSKLWDKNWGKLEAQNQSQSQGEATCAADGRPPRVGLLKMLVVNLMTSPIYQICACRVCILPYWISVCFVIYLHPSSLEWDCFLRIIIYCKLFFEFMKHHSRDCPEFQTCWDFSTVLEVLITVETLRVQKNISYYETGAHKAQGQNHRVKSKMLLRISWIPILGLQILMLLGKAEEYSGGWDVLGTGSHW